MLTPNSNIITLTTECATPPVNTVAPVISGTEVVGQTLSSTTGTWTGVPNTFTYSYQWKRGATNIGTNSSTYTLVAADAGNTSNITCVVTATNSAGSANATSNTIAQILTVRTNAFMTASGISDATIRGALNTFDAGLISNSLDTKMKAVYPFVGGTASTHKWNFMDAQDTNAAFRLVFSGTWTHSSNGALPNGSNAFADSFFQPLNAGLTWNNHHVSYYSRTIDAGVNPQFYEIGAGNNTGSDNLGLWTRRAANTAGYDAANFPTNRITFSNTDGRGFYVGSAPSSTAKFFRNGVSQASLTISNFTITNNKIYLGGFNENNSVIYYSNKQVAFASLGNGLSDSEVSAFNTLVTNFQTTLSRNV